MTKLELQPNPYSDRIPCPKGLEEDPTALLSLMLDVSLDSINHAVHHDGFNVSETSFVRGRDGLLYIVTGANYNPLGGEDPRRTCALGAMFNDENTVRVGDIFGGAVLIRSPENMKRIVGCRDSLTLHSCGPCRPAIARIDPNTVMGGIRGDGRIIEEALTIGQKIDYHDHGGRYPRTPNGLTPARFFLEAIRYGLNSVITSEARGLFYSTIRPDERT